MAAADRYPALRIIRSSYRLLAIVVSIAGGLKVLADMSAHDHVDWLAVGLEVLEVAFAALTCFALAEAIRLGFDVADDARRAAATASSAKAHER